MALDPESVRSVEELAEFLTKIVQEVEDGKLNLENPATLSYLDSAAAWMTGENPWLAADKGDAGFLEIASVAKIFLAAVMYE